MPLMIPGPIEVSPAVHAAFSVPPPSHVAPNVIEAFGAALEKMRAVWMSGPDSQPFVIAGSGTIAMDTAVWNLIEPGDAVVVVNTGYFSDRMAEMLHRRGASVTQCKCPLGSAPSASSVGKMIPEGTKAIFATHVDTSTGVRVDAEGLARLARARGILSVFDGVCATAAERFEMANWGADVYLTASQKAIGLPPGLALMMASARAMAAREALKTPPPMALDWLEWQPIMRAYEARSGSYFSTPATNLILALDVGLDEILASKHGDRVGIEARFEQHRRAAKAMRAAWAAMGLSLLPLGEGVTAWALSAVRYPKGVGPALLGMIKARGVIVAGGLHPDLKKGYFRVGHMGYAVDRPDMLLTTVEAIEGALIEAGHDIKPGVGAAAALGYPRVLTPCR